MGSEIGVGLIGTGFMGKCHALAYGSVKAVFGSVPTPRRLKLCDADADLARQRAEDYGFAEAVTDWRAIIADPAVQLVSITTPNALHREMAEAALAAGKHVWCEKPMGLTLADAESMAAAGRSAGVRTQLGYNYLRNPLIAEAKRLIESGEIGRITHFRGVVDEDYMADAEIPWSWRCQLAEAGLGALGD
ncbi:MAG: Gfo/Idh/MocA family protein, partial [Elstera sp.]